MPRIYKLKDGTRVPSVTTVLGGWGSAEGLIQWAHGLGLEGKSLEEARSDATGPGILAHRIIEADIRGEDPNLVTGPKEHIEIAKRSYESFLSWKKQTRLEFVESEVSLVSEQYRFGGTFDALALINGEPALLDWKGTGRIWPKFIAQLGGYQILVEENRPDFRPKRIHVVRLGKEFGEFTHGSYPVEIVETGKRAFLLAREMYEVDKTLRKAVGA